MKGGEIMSKQLFLCGPCSKVLGLSLEERLEMSKQLQDKIVCTRCSAKYHYWKGSYQRFMNGSRV